MYFLINLYFHYAAYPKWNGIPFVIASAQLLHTNSITNRTRSNAIHTNTVRAKLNSPVLGHGINSRLGSSGMALHKRTGIRQGGGHIDDGALGCLQVWKCCLGEIEST